jgi:hypothetical protein
VKGWVERHEGPAVEVGVVARGGGRRGREVRGIGGVGVVGEMAGGYDMEKKF